jgi:hypothetical protein
MKICKDCIARKIITYFAEEYGKLYRFSDLAEGVHDKQYQDVLKILESGIEYSANNNKEETK